MAYASEVPTLDDLGWVRLHAGVTAYSSEYGEVNHYRFDGNHEFECLEMCADIATCISAVHVNGNCIVFDSAVTELPAGASLYQNGSFSVSFMLAQTAMIGAVTFAPPSVVANETFIDEWNSVAHTDPLGPVSSALNKYKFIDIGSSNCRQWCAAVIHCLAYKVTSGSDCYIYDSQVNEIPYGADSYTSGTRTLVSTVYTGSGDTLYYPDRTVAYASEVPTLDDLGWVRLHAGVTAYSSEYGEVNHYRFDGNHEFECLEMCAYIATCISAVHVNGNCIVFDSAVTELPAGASLYQNGSFSVSFMLAQTAMIGAVTFAPPSVVANETFIDEWNSVAAH